MTFYAVTVYLNICHMHLWIGFTTFDSWVRTSKYEIIQYFFTCSFQLSTIVNHLNSHDLPTFVFNFKFQPLEI